MKSTSPVRRAFARTRGASIIESVIAMGLVMTAAAGGLAMYAMAADNQGASRTTADAIELARAEIDRYRGMQINNVQLSNADYETLLEDPERRNYWQQHVQGHSQARTAAGVVVPYEENGGGGRFRILRYVDCSEAVADCGTRLRTVRVIVEGPRGVRAQIAARIGRPNLSGAPMTDTVTAPTGLTVTQVDDSSLQIEWNKDPSAASYRITRDNDIVADATEPSYLLVDQRIRTSQATTTTNVCVRSRNASRKASSPSCVTFLLRPTQLTSTMLVTTSHRLSWNPAPKRSDIHSYRFEWKPSYRQIAMSLNPIAHWSFDEYEPVNSASDRSNNLSYFGTVTQRPSLIYDPEASGRAVRVARGEPRIGSRNTILGWNNNAYTVSAWVNIEDFTNGQSILKLGATSASCGTNGGVQVSNGIGIGIGASNLETAGRQLLLLHECQAWVPSGYNMPRTGTFHIAVSYTAATARFYVNGSQVAVVGGVAAPLAPALPPAVPGQREKLGVVIGGQGHGRDFNGTVDEISVYPTVLSAAQIERLYEVGKPGAVMEENPISYWNPASSDGVTQTDLAGGGRNMTLTNAGPRATGTPPFGGELVRHMPLNSYAQVSNLPLTGARPFSISMWIRPTNKNGTGCVYDLWIDRNTPGRYLYLCWDSNGSLRMNIGHGSDLVPAAPNPLELNAWHHVVLAYSGPGGAVANRFRIYVNGDLYSQSSSMGNLLSATGWSLRFNQWNGSYHTAADLAEIGVFEHELSQAAVRRIYEKRDVASTNSSQTNSPGWLKVPGVHDSGMVNVPAGTGCGLYRVRAYKTAPAAGMVEGVDVATSQVHRVCAP